MLIEALVLQMHKIQQTRQSLSKDREKGLLNHPVETIPTEPVNRIENVEHLTLHA